MMIIACSLILASLPLPAARRPSGFQSLSNDEARLIAVDVVSRMALSGDEYMSRGVKFDDVRHQVVVSYRGIDVWIDRTNGRVSGIEDKTVNRKKSADWPANAYTRPRIIDFAQRYMGAVGFTSTVYVTGFARDPGFVPPSYEVRVTPTYQGVPYSYHFTSDMDIEPDTGKLIDGVFRAVPRSPLHMDTGVEPDTARASLAAYIFGHKRTEVTRRPITQLEEEDRTHLCIFQPNTGRNNPDTWYESEHLADAQAGRGHLAYMTFLTDFADSNIASYLGFVDARTGRLLEIETLTNMAGGGHPSPKPALFSWASWKGKIEASLGRKRSKVIGAAVSDLPTGSLSPKAIPIVLAHEKSFVAAMYDAATGILVADTQGKRSFGKANAALQKAFVALSKKGPLR